MPGLNTTQQTELDRITSLNKADLANPGSTTTPTAPTQDSTAVLNELIKQQLKRSDIVSSATTGSEQAVLDVRAQQAASESRITGRFDEQISNIKEAGADAFTSARESQRGFGTNRAALQQLTESTDKKVKEYEQMKTDALLQNDTQSASQISQLQVNAYQFQQQAEQQVFSNMLSLGNFAIKTMEEERNALASVNTMKASDIQTFVDERGDVVAKNKITGEVLWTAKGIGRAGQASPNIIVNPIADPITGKVKYTEVRDKDTGDIKYIDNAGKEVDPDEVQIGTAKDQLDVFIDSVMNDIINGLVQ